jgi:diguanylate cyclase
MVGAPVRGVAPVPRGPCLLTAEETVLMALPGSSSWWTSAVRAVLPQRGAVANAREAVQSDRRAAARRRDAGLGFAPGPEWSGAPAEFPSAAQEVLAGLRERVGLELWLVAAVDHADGPGVLASCGGAGLPVPVETVAVWARSVGRLVLAGRAPRVAPRLADQPGAVRVITPTGQLAAYLAVPLLAADGTLLGVLYGVSGREQPATLAVGLPEAERAARLLGTLLAAESAAHERARALALAYALADRDPVTGLMNRRGWETRLTVEEQRCHRHQRAASVLVIDLTAAERHTVPPGPTHGGDQVRDAARLLTSACRSVDVLARPDQGQLTVLAVECDAERAAELADRLHNLLRAAGLTPSVGVAARDRHQSLLDAWDQALEQTQHPARR